MSMKTNYKILISWFGSVILLLFGTSTFAQTKSSDLWLSSAFKYEILKDLDVKVEIGHRRENFYSSRLYGDFIVKYNLNKYSKIGIGWRHAGEGDPLDVDELTDRFHAELSGKIKYNDFNLNYRVRYQRKYGNWQTDEKGHLANQSVRTRLVVSYKLNKDWTFDAGLESFIDISYEEPMYVDKLRFIAGAEYRINKSQDIAIHYIRQQEIQVANPHISDIIAIDYSIDIKRLVKKAKKKNKKKKSQN